MVLRVAVVRGPAFGVRVMRRRGATGVRAMRVARVLGAVSDASTLATAVLLVPAAFLVGGAIWTWGAFTGRRA